jgi:hypothetical protein
MKKTQHTTEQIIRILTLRCSEPWVVRHQYRTTRTTTPINSQMGESLSLINS